MRNNPYAKAIKFFSKYNQKKGEMLIISHEEDRFFVTDGHFALSIPESLYDAYFTEEKPGVFPLIDSGTALRNGRPSDFQIAKCFENPSDIEAVRTPYTKDIPIRGKDGKVRLFVADYKTNHLQSVAIDHRFDECCEWADYYTGSSHCQPIFAFERSTGMIGIMLPIRQGDTDPDKEGKLLADLCGIEFLSVKTVA